MLKFFLSLIVILLFDFSISAQDAYIVQKVMGSVKVNSKPVTPGTQLTPTDKISFAQKAKLLVSSQKYGKLVLGQNPQTVISEREYTFKDLLAKSKQAGTKGNPVLGNVLECKMYFGTKFIIIGNQLQISLNKNAYPLDKNAFFYLSYLHPAEKEAINKKLPFTGQTLLFEKDKLFTVDGKPLPNPEKAHTFSLYYLTQQPNEKPKADLLATFELSFLDDAYLKSAMPDLLSLLDWKNQPTLANYESLTESLTLLLPDNQSHNNLSDWLEQNYHIAKPAK
jgi:hypothetical protein